MKFDMKSVRCDFTREEYDKDNSITGKFTFRANGTFYRADVDISPKAFMEIIVKNAKNIPFGKYVKHSEDEKKSTGKDGHYDPVKNATAIIASLIETEVTQ